MKAVKITVTGVVQGVGFRPFVYRLARDLGLKGYVKNLGGSEVEIVVEGPSSKVEEFVARIRSDKPPPAEIQSLTVKPTGGGFREFKIEPSGRSRRAYSMIPPDIGICRDCLAEVLDPKDRRYMYPLNSCAWCGPRFSMMEDIPYDRGNTSMRDFPMCTDCLREYRDPDDIRRFHAQGNCCPVCGPRVWLEDRNGVVINRENPVLEASRLVEEGYILAVKGLGGFHIACLATDDDIVLRLRTRKRRPEKPFALMALNLETARRIAYISEEDARLLESPIRPILLLPEREDSPVSRHVAPGLSMQGIMLPYTALHYMLLSNVGDGFLIMTSGNERGEPMCTGNREARVKLRGFVDYFLMHDRRIVNRVDDSVVRRTGGFYTVIRRGRGYAPRWVRLPFRLPSPVVALGAHYQNTGCLAFEDIAIPTQFVGDMDNLSSLAELERAVSFLLKTYRIDLSDVVVAVDKHPRYLSRLLAEKWIETYGCRLVEVQHHHAHAASVMVELGVKDSEMVAVTLDGAGYGDDGTVWGGEVLITGYGAYTRFGHLEQVPMPGGDRATEYPVRMLMSILSRFMPVEEVREFIVGRGLHKGLPYGAEEADAVLSLLERGDAPLTSSLGRVLDSASALLGICFKRTYEGEPAIKLEATSSRAKPIDLLEPRVSRSKPLVQTHRIFEELLEKLDRPREQLAYSVQRALGLSIGELAVMASKGRGVDRVLVSGGAAVNTVIFEAIREKAEEAGLKAYVNTVVPAGDGGVSLGQAAVAGFRVLESLL
ncbi:carbamoyltransferase HypF [Candidatus Bathyarchaeota archaeon]|nr:carbamoyltransferase HypF [Candidatus Bathyarchaeota archaeon]